MKNVLTWFLCFIPLHIAATETSNPQEGYEHVIDLVKWFSKNGGRLNKKVDVKKTDPDDPNSSFGLYALAEFYGKELIMSIPRKVFITAIDEVKGRDLIQSALPCETAFKLIREMELGNSSEYSSYVNFLKQQRYGQLPSTWSDEGKELLKTVVGDLRPDDLTTWIDHEWYEECKGEKDVAKENAAMMLISRGWDYLMIPLFDIMNHRNGNYLNTVSDSVMDTNKDVIQVRASRRILPGEQIYTSYNMCLDCDNRKEDYGTPEILRDYGFVESYPQRWIFDDVLRFEIRDNSTIEADKFGVSKLIPPTSDELEFEWIGDGDLEEDDKVFLEEEIQRLDEISETKFDAAKGLVPQGELDIILDYHNALSVALTLALENFPTLKEKIEGSEEL